MISLDEQFEHVACEVCGKPPGVSGQQCHESLGQKQPLCREYGACRIQEKTDEQLNYVLSSPSDCVFLKACPGSGKTEVVGLRAAYDIRRWSHAPGGVAVLTFTNNAAAVIRNRVRQFVGADKIGYPHFVGTIDSWLHGYIANPFAHLVTGYEGKDYDHSLRVVEDRDDGEWLNAYSSKTPYCVLKERKDGSGYLISRALRANAIRLELEDGVCSLLAPTAKHYSYVGDEDYYNSEAFVEYRKDKAWLTLHHTRKAFREAKVCFWQAGFATYQDIEHICLKLLSDNAVLSQRVATRFPLIIVDECQDLSEGQLRIMGCLRSRGVVFHFVGDMDQAIHSFRDVDPEKVRRFVKTNGFQEYKLSVNFRSYQPVVDLCSALIGRNGIQGRPCSSVDPVCICLKYEADEEPDLVKRFLVCLASRGIDPGRSAILARGDSTVRRLRPGFARESLSDVMKPAMAIHLWRSHSPESRQDAIRCMGAFVSAKFYPGQHADSRHHCCPQSISSPLRWRLTLSWVLDNCIEHKILGDLTCSWKEWVKALNSTFARIVATRCEGADSVAALNFRSPDGLSAAVVLESLDTVTRYDDPGIRIGTIHSAKGETLDAVMLVSSRSKSGSVGGHWREWITRDGGEHARFAFVGSSRPKYLLAWAVPSPTPGDKTQLESLGFTVPDEN